MSSIPKPHSVISPISALKLNMQGSIKNFVNKLLIYEDTAIRSLIKNFINNLFCADGIVNRIKYKNIVYTRNEFIQSHGEIFPLTEEQKKLFAPIHERRHDLQKRRQIFEEVIFAALSTSSTHEFIKAVLPSPVANMVRNAVKLYKPLSQKKELDSVIDNFKQEYAEHLELLNSQIVINKLLNHDSVYATDNVG